MSRIPWPSPEAIEARRDPETEAYFRESHRESTPAIEQLGEEPPGAMTFDHRPRR